MKKTLQILIPMGGLGQRFKDEGYITPKPLIEVEGKKMFLRALASFDGLDIDKKVLFIVREDAESKYGLASSIQAVMPDAGIVMLKENTEGAAQTALKARDLINPSEPLIIMDCDFEFTSKEYFSYVKDIIETASYDGVLLGFNSDNPRYSYVKVDDDGFVTETAEKKVISNNALWGAYCFSSGSTFIRYAERVISKGLSDIRKEYYVSYVYAEMLADGLKIKLANADTFNSFGTPVELNEYLARKR